MSDCAVGGGQNVNAAKTEEQRGREFQEYVLKLSAYP